MKNVKKGGVDINIEPLNEDTDNKMCLQNLVELCRPNDENKFMKDNNDEVPLVVKVWKINNPKLDQQYNEAATLMKATCGDPPPQRHCN